MVVLGLDLSTHTGVAALEVVDGSARLLESGTIDLPRPLKKYSKVVAAPWDMISAIREIGGPIMDFVLKYPQAHVCIEEMNLGRDRSVQKFLAALHYATAISLRASGFNEDRVYCMDSDGAKGWRHILGLKLTKEQRRSNKLFRTAAGKSERAEVRATTGAAGVVKAKHMAVAYVNSKPYGVDVGRKLLQKDNNTAEAVCLALARALQLNSISATVTGR